MKQNLNPIMFIGAVKWFDNNKGFGVLALPLGEDLFLHIHGFKHPPEKTIKQSMVIAGDKKPSSKRDGYVAYNCRILDHPDDWKTIVSLLGKTDIVLLQDLHRKDHRHSLMELAAEQLLRGKDEDSIFTMVTSGFDSSFEPSLFIQYAAFVEKVTIHLLGEERASPLTSHIFECFGMSISYDILFRVWKAGLFRYIGYNGQGDYEIPEEILNLNATEIGYSELMRIRGYSFGPAFCSGFVNALLGSADTMDRAEIDSLIPYLDFLENSDREYWKNIMSTS